MAVVANGRVTEMVTVFAWRHGKPAVSFLRNACEGSFIEPPRQKCYIYH